MQRHQCDLRALVVSVHVADQGSVIQELCQRLATIARIGGGIYQFAQVFDARVSLGRVFFLQRFDVSGAIEQEFEQLGSSGAARSCRLSY